MDACIYAFRQIRPMNYSYFSNICIFAICFTSNTYPEMRPLGSIPIQCIVQQLQPAEQVIQYLSTFYSNHRTFFAPTTFSTSQFFFCFTPSLRSCFSVFFFFLCITHNLCISLSLLSIGLFFYCNLYLWRTRIQICSFFHAHRIV